MQNAEETNMVQTQNINDGTTPEKDTKSTGKKSFSFRNPTVRIALGISLSAALLLYVLIGLHYQKVFFPATTVNGINVSGLTPEQALEVLNADAAEYVLTIIEDGENMEQIFGSDIGLCVKDDNTLHEIVSSQHFITWAFEGFWEKEYFLDTEYDRENLPAVVNALSCMDKRNWISPKDACIEYEKGSGYKLVPETAGTEILTDSFLEAVLAAVDRLDSTLSLSEAGVYKLPEIFSDDTVLNEQFDKLRPYSDMTVTYQFDSQTEILDSATLSEWVSLDKNGELVIDEEAAAEFVKGLAKKYNTAYSTKTLETSYGKTVTIKNGYYGWQIDRKTETENLLEVIRDGKSVTREPAYLLRAASHDGVDYGNTYVEINLTAQHLFFYKDGELVIESDFVSGTPSKGYATPDGAYGVTYKERNATLSGRDYSTKVSYWMPFNENIGMHDCTWRPAFGGVIYQTNGSRGCINLPLSVAQKIYENIEQGDPVLCYHLEGTGQSLSTPVEGQTSGEGDLDPIVSQDPVDGDASADASAPAQEEEPPTDAVPVSEEPGN